MDLKEINELITHASRPIDVFGGIKVEDVKKRWRSLAKICHPDAYLNEKEKQIAEKIMVQLNRLLKEAEEELANGIYNLKDVKAMYQKMKSLIEFNLYGRDYKIYEHLFDGDVGQLYRGLSEDDLIYLKICLDEDDNELVENEFNLLSKLDHPSIPKVIDRLKINKMSSIIFEDFGGYDTSELKKDYGNIPGEHIVWMLERMLSSAGYLHSQNIVHGNIKPINIRINPEIHNVMFLDYTLCIEKANEIVSKYKIINDYYSPPEIDASARVLPNSDIYAIGKIAIELLGGDLKTNGMPINISLKVREFIRKLVQQDPSKRANDAYALWDEIIDIRNKEYGKERFLKLEKKPKGGIYNGWM